VSRRRMAELWAVMDVGAGRDKTQARVQQAQAELRRYSGAEPAIGSLGERGGGCTWSWRLHLVLVVVEWKCRKRTCSAQIRDCRDRRRQRAQVSVKEGLVECLGTEA
jgi:hypothetical protein